MWLRPRRLQKNGVVDPAARSSAASRHPHRRNAVIVPDRVQPADGRIEIAQHNPVERLAIPSANSINSSPASSAGSPAARSQQIERGASQPGLPPDF